jgi:Glycosyl hydrolases family 39
MARFCGRILFLSFLGALLGSAFASDLQTPKGVIPASYFGLHIHHLAYPVPTPWPNIPVPQWRLWDAVVTWPDLEPSKGQWQFGKLDGYVSLAQQHGTGILLTLGGSPTWASARPQLRSNYYPGFTAEPADIEDWRIYVRTVVSRYKGRIQAYEIWNEPNLTDYWSGSTDQMLTLTKEASQIIRNVDPNALVVSPSATAAYGIPWLADFLKKGGGQYVDVIAFHFYVDPHTLPPEDMLPVIQRVRQVLAENGSANKPVWNTETGWLPPAKFDSDELAAGFLARAYILSWAAGVQRFYWYAWDNRYVAIITYKEDEHTVAPAGHAYEIIQRWIVGTSMNRCAESADHTWTCQLNRTGKSQWIVWNAQGNRKFDIPAAWKVKSLTPLLSKRKSLSSTTIDVGPIPVLLTVGS